MNIALDNYPFLKKENKKDFFFSQSIYHLFLFNFHIALARSSNTMLNRSDERGHHSLVSDLRGQASILTIKCDVVEAFL